MPDSRPIPAGHHWDRRYREGGAEWESGVASGELRRVLDEGGVKPGTAIEVGCGTGTNAIELARRGFDVTAIDFAPTAIARARSRAGEAGVSVRFLIADVLDPPPSDLGPCDFLFDRGCYHCARLIDAQRYLHTAATLTRPGSRYLSLIGNARDRTPGGPPRMHERTIRDEIGRLFQIEQVRAFPFAPGPRGRVYWGWACLAVRR